jgi:hypothetical protein
VKPHLIIPGARNDVPEFRCTVPVNAEGDTCGQLFYESEAAAYQRHTARCAQQHMDVIRALSSQRTQDGLFEPWDPEIAAHMAKVGERMKREGRLVVHPSERAGF